MALVQCTLNSRALGMNTNINVVLPEMALETEDHPKWPVLFLLHGGSDNYTNWLRNTQVEEFAKQRKIVVVMPSAEMSFYTDMAYGMAYYTYISTELLEFVQAMFPVSAKREDTYVSGLSMGGYGCLRIGLGRPEAFSAIGCFSGASDIAGMGELNDVLQKISEAAAAGVPDDGGKPFPMMNQNMSMKVAFGDDSPVGTENDPLWLAEQILKNGSPVPDLYVTVGTDDFVYKLNQGFKDKLDALAFPYTYEEWKGAHVWPFWNESLRRFLNRLPLAGPQLEGGL